MLQRSEEEKVQRREQAKRRSLQGLQNDAQKRAREFEKKVRKIQVCLKLGREHDILPCKNGTQKGARER